MMWKRLTMASIFGGLAAGPGEAHVIASDPSIIDLEFSVVSPLSLTKAAEPVLSASDVYALDFPGGSALSFQDSLIGRFIFLPGMEVGLGGRL